MKTQSSKTIDVLYNAVQQVAAGKETLSHLVSLTRATERIGRMAQADVQSKKYERLPHKAKTPYYHAIVKDPEQKVSPRSIKRAKRQMEITGISPKTQEALQAAGITKLDQVLIKGSERVDVELLQTIPGIGKTRIEEIKVFAAQCFEI